MGAVQRKSTRRRAILVVLAFGWGVPRLAVRSKLGGRHARPVTTIAASATSTQVAKIRTSAGGADHDWSSSTTATATTAPTGPRRVRSSQVGRPHRSRHPRGVPSADAPPSCPLASNCPAPTRRSAPPRRRRTQVATPRRLRPGRRPGALPPTPPSLRLARRTLLYTTVAVSHPVILISASGLWSSRSPADRRFLSTAWPTASTTLSDDHSGQSTAS